MHSTCLRLLTVSLAVALCSSQLASAMPIQPADPAQASAEHATPAWVEVRGGTWKVPPALVRDMQDHLRDQLDAHKLPTHRSAAQPEDYTVQLRGETAGGARVVRLVGFCHGPARRDATLAESFLIIMDGGACVFDATYAPDAHGFATFAFHGMA